MMVLYKKIYLFALAIGLSLAAMAQKLPSTQVSSVIMPDNVKIDGKADEFQDNFQAYNKSTNFYYTISNDKNRLYLTIKISDPVIINKVVSAGITFVIQGASSPEGGNDIKITYPFFDPKDRPQIDVKNIPKIITGQPATIQKADSLMNANNNKLQSKSKWIKTTGIKSLDSLTSIYNRDGIRVAEKLDIKENYVCEMAIDLKLLGTVLTESGGLIKYQIESNAPKMDNLNGVVVEPGPPGTIFKRQITILPSAMPPSTLQIMLSDTYLKGEYNLAK